MGVEEEYFLVDPGSGRISAAAGRVLARARAEPGASDVLTGEFTRHQIEARTTPCATLAHLRTELSAVRRAAARAARAEGLRLCASGTPVLGEAAEATERAPGEEAGDGAWGTPVGDHPRHRAGVAQYRAMMGDFAVCAQHVHVHCPDRECAVLVGNHLRPVLPTLVALSANSPFHEGRDTGYASWRSVIRQRFPCLGPPPYARSLAESARRAETIAAAEAMLAPTLPFWDVRPNPRLPTVEIRCPDVSADLEGAVCLAALVRALVAEAIGAVGRGDPGPRVGAEELRAAYWKAARDGVTGNGVDLATGRAVPAAELARALPTRVEGPLEAAGDRQAVHAYVRRTLVDGPGAALQRAAAREAGPPGAVRRLVAATEGTSAKDP
ncbi:YbdK family carboxylate-amine ligase [Streptomyces sp. CC208A]|uniref:carboxylate-amine ligase n=1 Tax=Streptomyces sp. CC208A TaxID=3044573 RepID=UPI0024A8B077|nr:YbdK family carboxylate-amine ligase [Streptomyces sp. CC208A]